MNAIVVGAGMIGKERIKALEKLGVRIICIVDPVKPDPCNSKFWASKIEYCENINFADWIFVCVPHDQVAPIVETIFARKKNIRVLVEKPLGRNCDEYKSIINKSSADARINVGFNYRFYKGIRELLNDCQYHNFGRIISVNMVLGLSNVPGTENTWRLDPKKAGSGSIIYAGIHLIDLAMLISQGTLRPTSSLKWSGFWKTGIEEEMHILATDHQNTIYNIQSSVNKWRSTLRIEVNGTDGYGIVEGRNKYYGNQTYIRGERWAWMEGKPQRETEEIVVSDYDGEDSLYEETKALLYGCDGIKPATHLDNYMALKFIEDA